MNDDLPHESMANFPCYYRHSLLELSLVDEITHLIIVARSEFDRKLENRQIWGKM